MLAEKGTKPAFGETAGESPVSNLLRAFVIQELGDPHRRPGTSRSLMRTRERVLNHPE